MKKVVSMLAGLSLMLVLIGCAVPSKVQLGYEKLIANDYPAAEQYFTEALEADPNDPYALLNMGVVYQNTGRTVEARNMYNRVIELDPQEKPSRTQNDDIANLSLVDIAKRNLAVMQ